MPYPTSVFGLNGSELAAEKELEDMITARPEILSAEWMLIGRQEKTGFGGIIDLLAIAPDGSLVLIELERDKTLRIHDHLEARLATSRQSAGKAPEAVVAQITNAAADDGSEKASTRRAAVK